MRGPGTRLAAAALVALAASCAPLPRPVSPPAPPVARPGAPAPLPPPAPAAFELAAEPAMDVGLAWDLDDVELTTVGSDAMLVTPDGSAQRSLGTIRVTAKNGEATFDNLGPRGRGNLGSALRAGDTLWVRDRRLSPEAVVAWRGKTWRGSIKIFVNPRGRLTVVDRLPLETYLLGVVPGEIGALSDALIEAGRAQAIAARGYTLFYRGRRGEEGFDLYGTVEDQVYGPVETERPLATRCVESTRGDVPLADGWPIRANYCSTCGGITAEAWEAWPTDGLRYLVSRRDRDGSEDYCAASPQYRWREEWTAAEFGSNLAHFAPQYGVELPPTGVGTLFDVRVASRSRSGRVWRLEVTTSTGTIIVPAYVLRQVLRRAGNAGAILRSNLFKVDVRRDPATGRTLAIVASGAGSGHGVGLCQTGALGMARTGKNAAEILEHYYTGVELRHMY